MGNHYIPQYFLHGFAEDGRLWAHDRTCNRSFLTQPKVVAHESGMYPPEVETYLANQIENPAKASIERIRNLQALTDSDRQAVAHYVVALWKRVPKARSRAAERLPAVAESVKAEVLTRINELVGEDPSLAHLADKRREDIGRIIAHYQTAPPPDIWQLNLKTEATPRIVDGLLSMKWRLIHSPKRILLASDNPVFFFEHEGIGKATSELTVPFSSTVALWANRQDHHHQFVVTASTTTARELNRRAAHNATRFLFSKTNESWILPFHRKRKWELHRLV